MSLGGDKPFGLSEGNATVTMLHYLWMNCLVRKVNKKRFIVIAFDEFNCVSVKYVRNVSVPLDVVVVFIDLGVNVGSLPFKTYPPIKARARRVVVPHVP